MSKKIESFAPHSAQPLKGQALKKENKVTSLAVKNLSQKFKAKSFKPTAPTKGSAKTTKFFFSALKKRRAA